MCLRSLVATVVLASCSLHAQTRNPVIGAQRGDLRVTSVTGESWLNHLQRSLDDTSMGKTWHLGPRAPEPGEEVSSWQLRLGPDPAVQTVILHGSDLYRLNCQGCHGESGVGAPPEINSIINPVRATSATLVMERMKNAGMNMSRANAAELARQAKATLLQRLHTGGQDMPAFDHFSEAEIRSLVAYLKQLAGVPAGETELRVLRESSVRVGEHIVKSTCHICHSAAGPYPSPEQLENGTIPPLGSLIEHTNLAEFVRKVTNGAPILMGDPPTPHRGRMPVFDYMSQNEAADVYLYLTLYPPSRSGAGALIGASLQQNRRAQEGLLTSSNAISASALPNTKADVFEPKRADDALPTLLILGAVWFTIHLLAGGLAFTLRVFMKLSAESEHFREAAQAIPAETEEVNRRAA
jgi:mono/diheme cytochrome c family protein